MSIILKIVLKWLGGISADQFNLAVKYVLIAAGEKFSSDDKRATVLKWLSEKGINGWVANLLVEAAYAFSKKENLFQPVI